MSETIQNCSEVKKVRKVMSDLECDIVGDGKSEITGKEECEDNKPVSQRENRLTNIIDQLRCQNKMKGSAQRDFPSAANNGEGGSTGRRCVRDATSPAQRLTLAPSSPSPQLVKPTVQTAVQSPAPPVQTIVKSERLSPHASNSSGSGNVTPSNSAYPGGALRSGDEENSQCVTWPRSRSVTPSTSSYLSTPPERGSPNAPTTAFPPLVFSDAIRSLAARHNTHPSTDYLNRMNGIAGDRAPASAPANANEMRIGGVFGKLKRRMNNTLRPCPMPVFQSHVGLTYSKTLEAIARLRMYGRLRRKRVTGMAPEHSPLDLSAAGESAAKRARLSASPRSDTDDREDRSESRECVCAESSARITTMSVNEVYEFVKSIDICAEYAPNFREQRIDGAGLPLLTEDHLTGMLQMKLGPALKLKATLARSLEPCAHCQAAAVPANTTYSIKMNGAILKPQSRSNSTSPC